MFTQSQDIDKMDFDELECSENKVDNPEPKKPENKADGSDEKCGHEDKERRRSSRHKRDELDGSSKRSSSRKESNGHEKDRKSRNGASRDKERSTREHRTRGNERSRDRDGDRNRERDSDKKRERNREKEREHSKRGRNHEERHEDEQGREKSSNLESREKDVVKQVQKERGFRGPDNDNRKYKEKNDGEETQADSERDQRTVFAYQVSLKAGERDLYDFFSSVGKVRDVQLIMDSNTRSSKGVGYIEFYDSMSVPMAIALSGQLLLDHPVMVKPSEAEKNLVRPSVAIGGNPGPYSGGARRLYVGNLPLTINENQLREVFEAFGTIELVQMPTDLGTLNCKGYAFIQFARVEDSNAAQSLNGKLDIAGHSIKVSAVTDQAGMQDAGANMADFDDDDEGITFPVLPGLTAADLSMPPLTGPSIDSIDVPSECLLLKNMFDPNTETEPDFDLDIKEDCENECSKYGSLKHIYVEMNSNGFVYLRFEHTQSAVDAQLALHGRWFAGKMIIATFMHNQEYEAKFSECG